MRNLHGGFIVPLLLVILALFLAGGGFYAYERTQVSNPEVVNTTETQELKPIAVDSISISDCTDIHEPGNYVLTEDVLSQDGKPCITVHDTSSVVVDCVDHTIATGIGVTALSLDNLHDFTISSCIMKNTVSSPARDALSTALTITNSQIGTITNNTIGTSTFSAISDSSHISVTGNRIYGQFIVHASTEVVIKSNAFKFIPAGNQLGAGTILNLTDGSNNEVTSNTFDGGSDGILRPDSNNELGADDSITMAGERNDMFGNNDIKNNWDCGIENTGFIFDSKILNNRITNVGVAGICGWYFSSLKGNLFDGNIVSDAPELFRFYRLYGVKNKNESHVYFEDNTFSNNKFTDSRNSPGQQASYVVIGVPSDNSNGIRPVTKADIIVGNNRFTNNDFGTKHALNFSPAAMFTDGGGNICAEPLDHIGFPLKCSSR